MQSAKCNHVAKRNHTAKCKCKNSTKSSRSISCAMKKRRRKSFFLHIFHLQRTLQRYHFATSETDDKSKTNVQMWSKNFHKAFWDTIFHKKILTNQENGGITDQYKSLKGNIRKISIAYNLNYPHLVDCKIQNFGDICKIFGWTSWVIVLFPP